MSKAAPDVKLQQRAYGALSSVFAKYEPQEPERDETHPPITIEILPKGIEPSAGQYILEDETERSVGVPKKVLVAAFLFARDLFISTPKSEHEGKVPWNPDLVEFHTC